MNEITLTNTSLPVLTACDLMAAPEPFFHADRILDFNVLIYVTEGVIYVTEEETDHSVGQGELLFLKAGLHHFGKTEISRGTTWYYMHFYLNDSAELPLFMPDPSPILQHSALRHEVHIPKKLSGLSGSVIEEKISALTEYCHCSDSMKRWNANALLWEILTCIAMYEQTDSLWQSLSDRICGFLSTHYNEKFSSSALEKQFYLSYKHMAAVFRKEKGMTMQQYHSRIRMEEAARLLRSTLLSVGEISLCMGFSDTLYFSRCFHDYSGMSPTDYRKNAGKKY